MEKENAPATNGNESAQEQRDFNPAYPHHDTQAARLLAVMLQGQKINPASRLGQSRNLPAERHKIPPA